MNFRKNMTAIRTLSADYYQGRISFEDYRSQRSRLLQLIDEDLNGVKAAEVIEQDDEEDDNVKSSFLDKALSFLKTEQQ